MGDRTPTGGEGPGLTPADIEHALSAVREALEMDVAFVSRFDGDRLVFRAIEGDVGSFGWREGQSFPLDDSYCRRVPDGRPYGTLCCASHASDPWLRERDLGLMGRTAQWLIEHLERSGRL